MTPNRQRLHEHATPLLHDYVRYAAAEHGNKPALICGNDSVTWGAVDRASSETAAFLEQKGVQRGDRILVFGENTIETVIAFFSVLKANAVVSIINPQTKPEKLAYLLRDCRATALFTEAHLAKTVNAAIDKLSDLKLVVCVGNIDAGLLEGWPTGTRFADARVPGAQAPRRRCIESDLASIIYTSGTTGEPKGVMLTHHNMTAATESVLGYLQVAQDDRILCALPLSFGYGLYQPIMAAARGATVVLERTFAYPAKVVNTIMEHQVTGIPGVPTMFATLAAMKDVQKLDWSRVRFITCAAAALSERLVQFLRQLMPDARLYVMYGQTECKRGTYLPPEDLDRKSDSIGIAIPNTELWAVDENDQRVGPNQVGQLVIRGPTVMQGYWEKPEATREKLRPGPVPGEVVLYTGDLCRIDEEGYVYFVSRMDDVINARGEKVSPKLVEHALTDVPEITDAAVIGVPDDLLGEAVKAFVVLAEGSTLTEREVIRACQQRLEGHMVPKSVVFLAELPKTANGKVIKKRLA